MMTHPAPSVSGTTPSQESTERDVMAFQATGEWLAREISLSSSISYDEALGALHGVSDGMLALLASPSGWYALTAFIEMNLGRPLSGYAPSVH